MENKNYIYVVESWDGEKHAFKTEEEAIFFLHKMMQVVDVENYERYSNFAINVWNSTYIDISAWDNIVNEGIALTMERLEIETEV